MSAEGLKRVIGSVSATSVLNNRLAVFLLVLVALSPVPLGSNRPVFWALSGALIALAGMVYFAALLIKRLPLRTPLTRYLWPVLLFGIFVVCLMVQIVPVGPITFTSHSGFEITSNTLSLAPGQTVLMLLRQLGYGLFFFLMLQVSSNEKRAERMLVALLFIGTAHALIGLMSLIYFGDKLLFLDKAASRGSATGTFVNRNSYATYMAMSAVVGVGLTLQSIGNLTKSIEWKNNVSGTMQTAVLLSYFVCITLIISAALLTQSRVGNLALFVGVVCCGTLFALRSGSRFGVIAGAFVAVVGAGVALLWAHGGGLFGRLGSAEKSLDDRGALYAQIWEMILTRPVLGFGGGSFELAYPLFHRPPVSAELIWDKAHATYLTLWSELGLVFGTLPVLILFILGLGVVKSVFNQKLSATSLAAVGALLVCALHSLFDFSLEIQANTYMLLAIVAIGSRESTKESKIREVYQHN